MTICLLLLTETDHGYLIIYKAIIVENYVTYRHKTALFKALFMIK